MLYRAIFFLFLLCSGNPYSKPLRTLAVDTSFLSDTQKRVIKEAEESWTRQTKGCIKFEESPTGVHFLRMTPPEKYDHDNSFTYGMCLPAIGDCRTIELAFSRMANFDEAVIVAAHELGHAIGLRHVCGDGYSNACPKDDHSLMRSGIDKAWINLSPSDRKELERATGCILDGG